MESKPIQPLTNQIKYHFASKAEGQKLLSENTEYYNKMNQADIEWRLRKKDATIKELIAFAQDNVLEFTNDEKEDIKMAIKFIEESLIYYGFKLPFPEDGIIFIKTTMLEEGGAAAYTHETQIYFGEQIFPSNKTANLPPFLINTMKTRLLHKFFSTVAHEIFHCLTRHSPEFRKRMYRLIGFTILDHDLIFSQEIKNKILNNPDVEHMDNYAEFTIDGVKRKCEIIVIMTKTWQELNDKQKENDVFFRYIETVLVPIDALDTYYSYKKASDFDEIVGKNTPYNISPEEILADNFKEVIMRKNFNDFESPELLYNMVAALKEFK